MKITVSGAVGSGKSTVSKMLAKKLRLEFVSIGDFMRGIAKKRHLTIMDLSKRAEVDSTIDEELDEKQVKFGQEHDGFVIDSRLGFHFIPDSYKIFLNVNLKEAAKRIIGHRRAEERYKSQKEAEKYVKERMRSENIRYKEYYGIDFPTKSDFDLIIDTTSITPEQAIEKIVKKVRK
ncbi:AAA family ATPase [Candidatus Woesearchaeota archaeon]|nr:AAA family ATPase [Candidatus Woesearchaeota archaeon]